jgi:hypothetical protein
MTVDVLAVQFKVAECVASLPVPANGIVSGKFEALLVIVRFPFTVPEDDGVNATFSDADAPGFRISPVESPFALKPGPETATFEIVTFESPELVSVRGCMLLLPIFTSPKVKVDMLEINWLLPEFVALEL